MEWCEKTEELGGKPVQCHSFDHKTHTDRLGIKPRGFFQRELLWCVDERVILKWIFRKLDGTCTGFISVDKKNQLDVTFCIFISLLIVAQHVSGNHVPIIRS